MIAAALGVDPAPYPGPADASRGADEGCRDHLAEDRGKARSVPDHVEKLASWWHTDADLGRTLETFTSMTKSRKLGFADSQDTEESSRTSSRGFAPRRSCHEVFEVRA